MDIQDFSNGFDTLLSSYLTGAVFDEEASKGEVTLDEYEKSQFLTKAQEEIVLGLYAGRNSTGNSFEETEEMRRYLSDLIMEAELSPLTSLSGKVLGMDSKSKFFTLPEKLWFIIYESVAVTGKKCKNDTSMGVVPITHDEYHRLKKNPFRGANRRRALRLDLSAGVVEIRCNYEVTSYYVRYLRRLSPILLTDLSDGMTLEGEDKAMGCQLHEGLHQRILERAVMLALQSRGYAINNNRE